MYKLYCALVEDHSATLRLKYKPQSLRECVQTLAYSLLQQGDPIRRRESGLQPAAVPDIASPIGRKIRADAKLRFRTVSPQGMNHSRTPLNPHAWTRSAIYKQQKSMKQMLEKQPWRTHQSIATVCKNDGGDCQYNHCPGLLRKNKQRRSYPTRYRCYQCSVECGRAVYLCNTVKKQDDGSYRAILCHMKYHSQSVENTPTNSTNGHTSSLANDQIQDA